MKFNLCYPLAALSLVFGTRAGSMGLTPERRPIPVAVGHDTGVIPSVASSMPRLTSELLAQLQNLLQALHHLPKTVQDSAKATMDTVTSDLTVPGLPPISGSSSIGYAVVNWGTMAIHSPSVAAAFTQAHLSPHGYLPLVTTVLNAHFALQILGGVDPSALADTSLSIVTDTATVLAKNVEFAHLHQALMQTVIVSMNGYEGVVMPAGAPRMNSIPQGATVLPVNKL